MAETPGCPHCEPTHTDPEKYPWGVYLGPERDRDGQPIRLYVERPNGAHVAQSDADWLWELIHEARQLRTANKRLEKRLAAALALCARSPTCAGTP